MSVEVDRGSTTLDVKIRRAIIGFEVNMEAKTIVTQYKEEQFTSDEEGNETIIHTNRELYFESNYEEYYKSSTGENIRALLANRLKQEDPSKIETAVSEPDPVS